MRPVQTLRRQRVGQIRFFRGQFRHRLGQRRFLGSQFRHIAGQGRFLGGQFRHLIGQRRFLRRQPRFFVEQVERLSLGLDRFVLSRDRSLRRRLGDDLGGNRIVLSLDRVVLGPIDQDRRNDRHDRHGEQHSRGDDQERRGTRDSCGTNASRAPKG